MSVNSLNTFLNIRDSHLRVVSGNVYATGMNIGGINIDVAHGLQSVTDQGNVTSNTLQFSNATTAFVTTANITVGRDLTVTGNAMVSENLTVSGNINAGYLYGDASNVTNIVSNLHQIVENGNVTSNTVQFTNATTGFITTSNVEVGGDLNVVGNIICSGLTVQLVHRHVYDYHTVNSNNGLITPMNTSITPKFSSSKILVQMMVNGEGQHDATFRILRYIDGSSTGVHMPPDTAQTPADTDGIAPVTYDGDNNSTMGSVHIMFVDTPNTTDIVEYKLYYKRTGSSDVNRFSLNQVHADATASYTAGEHTSSSVVLQEIAQ